MRRIGIAADFMKRFLPLCYRVFVLAVSFFLTDAASSRAAEKAAEKIFVFPSTPYDSYLIYESLVVFWLFILSLLVIIRLKLREIERIQALGVEEEDRDAPLLE